MSSKLSLSSIIDSFTKIATADEEEQAALEAQAAAEAGANPPVEDEGPGADVQEELGNAEAHLQADDQDLAIVDASKAVVNAYEDQEEAVEALKDLATQAALRDEDVIRKEAALHGQVLAHVFLEELEKHAAYQGAQQSMDELLGEVAQNNLAAGTEITKEAFDLTNAFLSKLAESDADASNDGEGDYEEDSADGIDTEVTEVAETIAKEAFDLTSQHLSQVNSDFEMCKQAYEQAFFMTNDCLAKLAETDSDEAGEGSCEEDSAKGIKEETPDCDVEEIAKEAFDLTSEYLQKMNQAEDD